MTPTREWEKVQETSAWISLTPPDVSFPLTGPASHPHTATVVNLSCEYKYYESLGAGDDSELVIDNAA